VHQSSERTIRWGIAGTGWIAEQFATNLALVPGAELRAVGSRTRDAADAFADRFGIPVRHAGYRALAEDEDVDVVYVAVPHPWHHEVALAALRGGRNVLCEKPLTINADEARELISEARHSGLFLMEAMWSRFLPSMVRVRRLLDAGAIGEVRSIRADLGMKLDSPRLRRPELGGGALLDLGVYPVSFASFVLGRPDRITAVATMTEAGVDAQTSVVLEYPGGAQALLGCTMEVDGSSSAIIAGTEGRLELDGPMHDPSSVRLVRGGDPEAAPIEEFRLSEPGRGYRHEAIEVVRCLRAGLTESATMPLDESISIMETLDEIRRQIGLRYAFERPIG